MNGDKNGVFSCSNNNSSLNRQNTSLKRLNENTYSTLNRCLLTLNLDKGDI